MALIPVITLVLLAAGISFGWPVGGILLLVAGVPFDLPFKAGMTVYSNELLLLGVWLGYGLNLVIRKNLPPPSWRVLAAGVPYFAALVLSGCNANSWLTVGKGFLHATEFILVIWLVENLLQAAGQVHLALKLFLLLAVGVSCWGIGQTCFNLPGLPGSSQTLVIINRPWVRAAAGFGHPNPFAGYLLLPLPLLWLLLLRAPGWKYQAGAGLVFLPLFLAFLCTLSRTAWVVFFLVAGFLVFIHFKKRYFLLGLIILEGLFLLAAQPGPWVQERWVLLTRVHSLIHFQATQSWVSRQAIYRHGLKMWQVHPWLGSGAGTYARLIKNYVPADSLLWVAASKHIHNLYLQILIETGILGLLGFAALLGYVFWSLLQGWRRQPVGLDRLLLEGIAAGAVAFLLQNFYDVLLIYGRGIHFGLWLGMGLALARISSRPRLLPDGDLPGPGGVVLDKS